MSETKFTPGPWKTSGKIDSVVGLAIFSTAVEGRGIAEAMIMSPTIDVNGYNAESIANAHLIAAAPDLYEALEDLAAQVGKMPSDTGGNMGRMVASLCGAKMAIDKARGKS